MGPDDHDAGGRESARAMFDADVNIGRDLVNGNMIVQRQHHLGGEQPRCHWPPALMCLTSLLAASVGKGARPEPGPLASPG
jgi:hypothetical protein